MLSEGNVQVLLMSFTIEFPLGRSCVFLILTPVKGYNRVLDKHFGVLMAGLNILTLSFLYYLENGFYLENE